MARYRKARLRIVRKLQGPLPGLTAKSAEQRPYPPGQHGPGRRAKISDYRVRLEEKQKLRYNYGLTEKQLRRYYKQALRRKGDTSALLLQMLESRLDNVVFRAGFAATIPAARQLINHGHVRVNGHKVDIASYLTAVNDKIILTEKAQKIPQVLAALQARPLEIPSYLAVEDALMQATVTSEPSSEDVPMPIQRQLVVEYYSRVA